MNNTAQTSIENFDEYQVLVYAQEDAKRVSTPGQYYFNPSFFANQRGYYQVRKDSNKYYHLYVNEFLACLPKEFYINENNIVVGKTFPVINGEIRRY